MTILSDNILILNNKMICIGSNLYKIATHDAKYNCDCYKCAFSELDEFLCDYVCNLLIETQKLTRKGIKFYDRYPSLCGYLHEKEVYSVNHDEHFEFMSRVSLFLSSYIRNRLNGKGFKSLHE